MTCKHHLAKDPGPGFNGLSRTLFQTNKRMVPNLLCPCYMVETKKLVKVSRTWSLEEIKSQSSDQLPIVPAACQVTNLLSPAPLAPPVSG